MPNELGIAAYTEILTFQDLIHFDFPSDRPLAIRDVIAHLEGMEEIGRKIPSLLDKLVSAKDIKRVSFRNPTLKIEKLESGSLTDWINFGVELVVMGEASEETKKKMAADIKNMSVGWKVAILFGWLAAGGLALKGCVSPSSNSENNANYESLQQQFSINIGNTFNINPDKVRPVLNSYAEKATASDQKAGINFFRPARQTGASIKLSADDALEISDSFIGTLPEEYVVPAKTEHVETRENVELQLRALDMDNPEKGWAAVIPDVLPEHRIKLELDPQIDRSQLARLCIRGDVQVTYRIQKDGSKKAVKALLLAIRTKTEE